MMQPRLKADSSVPVRTTWLDSIFSGRNGSGAVRSRTTNSAQSAADNTDSPMIGADSQGKRTPPEVSASSSDTAAAIINTLPRMSSLCGRATLGNVLSTALAISKASRPSGMLIQKITVQWEYSDRKPPSTGPEIAAVIHITLR